MTSIKYNGLRGFLGGNFVVFWELDLEVNQFRYSINLTLNLIRTFCGKSSNNGG